MVVPMLHRSDDVPRVTRSIAGGQESSVHYLDEYFDAWLNCKQVDIDL